MSEGGFARRARFVIATLSSLALGVAIVYRLALELEGMQALPALVLAGLPVCAAAALWSRRIAAQIFARAVWWSLQLFGTLLAVSGEHDARQGVFIVAASAVALLAAGRAGLASEEGRFRPVAFRGTLVLALVLAMADTTSFLWIGILGVVQGRPHAVVILLMVPMLAGVIGLLRLRTWGLVVGMVSSALVASLALAGRLGLPDALRALFVCTAVAQLLVPVPMIVAIVTRRPVGPDGYRRAKAISSAAAILVLVGVSLYGAFVHDGALFPF